MQVEDDGWPQAEWSAATRNVIDQIKGSVKLPQRVLCFMRSDGIRVGKQPDFFGNAMALVVAHLVSTDGILSAASSTTCRVTRAFSMLALP